jgi:hypothetical protein
MADLNDTASWDEVYQLEDTDFMDGGQPDRDARQGIDNVPHQELANRTRWLRDLLENTVADVATLQGPDPYGQYLTTGRADGRYVRIGATDPFQQYLTIPRAEAIFSRRDAADPFTQYLTNARGDARYVVRGAGDPLPQYFTEPRGDSRYVVRTASDPFSQYLTNARGDVRYPLKSASDPYSQYLNEDRGDARYPLRSEAISFNTIVDARSTRAWGQTYQNVFDYPIAVSAFTNDSGSIGTIIQARVGQFDASQVVVRGGLNAARTTAGIFFIVPPGFFYMAQNTRGALSGWFEWRVA